MATRFPQSATAVAYKIATAYASKVKRLYWAAGANSVHKLAPGDTVTTILTRTALAGATFDATNGTIKGQSSATNGRTAADYFQDSAAGGLGVTEAGPYTYITSFYGDLFASVARDAQLIGHGGPMDQFSTYSRLSVSGYSLQGLMAGGAGASPINAGLSDDVRAWFTMAVRYDNADATAKLRVWINGAENAAYRITSTSPSSTAIGVTGTPLYFGGTATGTGNTSVDGEFWALCSGLTDAEMTAITNDPTVLIEVVAADTTAPTLSAAAASGGTLTCSGSVSTNEANGSLYAVFSSSATAPTATQVEAGQDNAGGTSTVGRSVLNQAVTATGTQTIASGAIGAGTWYPYFMHKDAAGNRSTVAAGASFVVIGSDSTPPDTGAITIGTVTDTSIQFSWGAGTDNVGVASYDVSKDSGSTWVSLGNVLTHTFTGLTANTAYGLRVRSKDAAGNVDPTPSSASQTTLQPYATSFSFTASGAVSLTGLKAAVFAGVTPDLWGAPLFQAANVTTNSSGVCTINVTGQTARRVGELGSAFLTNSDGTTTASATQASTRRVAYHVGAFA